MASTSPTAGTTPTRWATPLKNRTKLSIERTVVGATWANGILDGALQFDGMDDYVDCGSDPALVPPAFTISMWLHTQATSGSRTVLSKGTGDTERDLFFELFGAQYPTLSFGDGSQSLVLYAGSKLALGEWVHIALTRADTDAAIYINGSQLIRKAYDFTPVSTDHNLIIGGGLVQPYQGRIDDVCIYASALSDEDIADLAAELE